MARMKNYFSSSLLLVASVMLASLSCSVSAQEIEKLALESKPAMFVFGDSLFDVGNNQYYGTINFSSYNPYGETYFHHPTGRASDGRLVPDFIATFAGLPRPRPYLEPGVQDFTRGTNFASIGASVLADPFPNSTELQVINLYKQITFFKNVTLLLKQELGDEEATKLLKRAVYLISIGGNDYFSFSKSNTNASASSRIDYVNYVIGNLTNIIEEIYDLGGRKIAIQGVSPVGCEPGARVAMKTGDQCAENVLGLCRRHNKALLNTLKGLELTLPGFKYSNFDFYNSLYERIKSPSKYGFKESKTACCGSGPYRTVGCGNINVTLRSYELCSDTNEYVFFDAAHGTDRLNQQLAELFWMGSPKVTKPYNLKQLFELPSFEL